MNNDIKCFLRVFGVIQLLLCTCSLKIESSPVPHIFYGKRDLKEKKKRKLNPFRAAHFLSVLKKQDALISESITPSAGECTYTTLSSVIPEGAK